MASPDLERLRRWVASGAHWRIESLRPGVAAIALLTCDGGEVVDHFASRERDVLDLCAALPDGE